MYIKSFVGIILFTIAFNSKAQQLEFSPKETGFPSLNYVAKEISKNDVRSSLLIPGFNDRSALASRWMMCVYTNLAMIRHKRYWISVYPQDGDIVLVGFLDSVDPDRLKELGPEFLSSRAMKALDVDKMSIFCRSIGYRFVHL